MSSLQLTSKKIKKKLKADPNDPNNSICGACATAYRSYPALYIHVKRKHNGIMPPGTKINKRLPLEPSPDIQAGRPNKPQRDIDDLDESEMCLEIAQNDLMRFLGEDLEITRDMGSKPPLKAIQTKIMEAHPNLQDKWLIAIQEESKAFLLEYQERDLKMLNLDFEDDFMRLDPNNALRVLVWFMMWLGKVHTRLEIIPDLYLIFSRMWKVLDDMILGVKDLDNKLIWRKICKECEEFMANLPVFKNDMALLNIFIQKVGQIVGKVFEEKE